MFNLRIRVRSRKNREYLQNGSSNPPGKLCNRIFGPCLRRKQLTNLLVRADHPKLPLPPLKLPLWDLNLSKKQAEVLASGLKEKNNLSDGTKVTLYRTSESGLLQFFSKEDSLVFCNDVSGLLQTMGIAQYSSDDWRLLIDSSKASLKVVLLHNGNKYAPLPIGNSTKMKEEYDSTMLVLNNWHLMSTSGSYVLI